MVFTANAGMVLGKTAIVSRFHNQERQPEECFFRNWFESNGFAIAPWPQDVSFEAAGDALLDRAQPLIWCGYGFRSSAIAPSLLENILRDALLACGSLTRVSTILIPASARSPGVG